MSDTASFDAGFPLYEKLVLANAGVSDRDHIEDGIKLLTRFKGHVKKELVHVPSIGRYFEALIFVLDAYSSSESVKLVLLAHSSLCYLVKRVVMQAPSFFGDLKSVENITIHLFMFDGNEAFDGKNFWVSSVKAFEAIYLLQPDIAMDCILKLVETAERNRNPHRLMKALLLIDEFLKIMKKNKSLDQSFNKVLIETMTNILNTSREDQTDVVKLIHEVVSKNFKAQEKEIIQQIRNEAIRLLFEAENKSHEQTFDINVELNRILAAHQIQLKQGNQHISPYSKEITCNNMHTILENLLLPFQNPKETEQNWKLRQANLLEMRKVLREETIVGNQQLFISVCKDLQMIESIGKAVLSLRTTLSMAACQIFKDFLQLFKNELDFTILEQMFSILKNLLSTAKKISSTAALQCLIIMLMNVGFHQKLFHNCLMLINEKTVSPRICSSILLRIFLIKFTDSKLLDNSLIYIEEWLKKGITDAQTSVRETMRITFWYYYKGYTSNAKTFLLSQFSPQLKKAIELSVPSHLQVYSNSIGGTAVVSSFTSNSDASTQRSNFGYRKYPSYAQPTHSYNASLHRLSNGRSSSENVPSELEPNVSNRRKVSAPAPIAKRILTMDQESIVPQTQRYNSQAELLCSETDQEGENSIQIDLTNEFSNGHSNSLISKYLSNTKVDDSILMRQNLSSNSLERVKDGLQALQRVLLKNSGSNRESFAKETSELNSLIPLIRQIMFKHPQELKSLLSVSLFCKIVPLTYIIELHAINFVDFDKDIMASFSFNLLLEEICQLLRKLKLAPDDNEIQKSPETSLHYMKYRRYIFDFTFKLLIRILSLVPEHERLDERIFCDSLLTLSSLYGQEFDERLYFDIFHQMYLYEGELLISTIQTIPSVSTKLKICKELENSYIPGIANIIENTGSGGTRQNDPKEHDLSQNNELNNEENTIIDDKKLLEMTMVNPFNQNRSVSGGSVVHHDPNNNDQINHEEIDIQDRSRIDGPKLSEITKVFSVYELPQQHVSSSSILDMDGDSKMLDENKENSVNLSDIFGNDVRKQDYTVTFSDAPPKIMNPDTRPPSSRTSEVISDGVGEENDISKRTSFERDKSPVTPLTDRQSKELSQGINNIEIGIAPEQTTHEKSSLSSQLLVSKMLEADIDEASIDEELLKNIPLYSLTYYEIMSAAKMIDNSKEEEDNYDQMKKAICRIQNRSFTIRHLNYLIGPLVLYSKQKGMKDWLRNEKGYDELLELSKMLLTSTDETSLLPLNMASKSIVLIDCIILLNKEMDGVSPFLSSIFREIWMEIIAMVSKLLDYSNEVYVLLQELRDLLVNLQFFNSKYVASILSILATQTQEVGPRMKETFLMETLATILSRDCSFLKRHQFPEIVQTMLLFIESDCVEWRHVSCLVLANVLRHMKEAADYAADVDEQFSSLSERQFHLVSLLASRQTEDA